MNFVANIVAAEEEEIEAVGFSDHPVGEWSGFEARNLGTTELATLHCLLCDEHFEEALEHYEPAWVSGDEDGAVVLRIPDAIMERLLELDEAGLDSVAEELAATEAFEHRAWPFEQVQALVQQLGELAQIADSQGQVLLAWLHSLST